METENSELVNLVASENFNTDNPVELNRELTNFLKSRTKKDDSFVNKSNEQMKKDEIVSFIESSSFELSSFNINNEIINGMRDFEFESSLEKCNFPSRKITCKNLRKKSHAQIVAACAHAVYFVGIANRIRRNIDEIRTGSTRQKNSILLNEMKKTPGLQIGIIGNKIKLIKLENYILLF